MTISSKEAKKQAEKIAQNVAKQVNIKPLITNIPTISMAQKTSGAVAQSIVENVIKKVPAGLIIAAAIKYAPKANALSKVVNKINQKKADEVIKKNEKILKENQLALELAKNPQIVNGVTAGLSKGTSFETMTKNLATSNLYKNMVNSVAAPAAATVIKKELVTAGVSPNVAAPIAIQSAKNAAISSQPKLDIVLPSLFFLSFLL